MSNFWEECKLCLVPAISDLQIEHMLSIMKPVKYLPNNFRYREILIDGVDRRNTSYIWEERLGSPVKIYQGDLNSVEIITFHKWSHPALFKPSLAEVLASIKRFVIDYSLVRYFQLQNTDSLGQSNVIGDCHWCRCRLFGSEQLNVIDDTWGSFVKECEDVPCSK